MRKRYQIWITILLLLTAAWGQDGTENAILLMDGGTTELDFSFYWQILSQNGISIGHRSKDVWDVWENPASLVSCTESYVNLGLRPGFSIRATDQVDITPDIQSGVDDAIADFRTADSEVIYPQIGASLGQQGGLYGFQVALPFQHGNSSHSVISLELGQPLYLNLSAVNNGISTLIETSKEVSDQTMNIHMKLDMLMQLNLLLRASNQTFGLAHQFGDKFALGLRIGQTKVQSFFKGLIAVNGIMATAGSEYAFNDPNDPRIDFAAGETNKLDQALFLDFDGSSMNVQIGGLAKLNKSLVVGIDYDWHSSAILEGDMHVEQYRIPALNFEALGSDDDEEAELVEPTELNLAKLTLTESVENEVDDQMEIYFPSSLGLQLSFQNPSVAATLLFHKYFNQIGYDFLGQKQYFAMQQGFGLQLTLGWFTFSGGMIQGEITTETDGEKENAEPLQLPHGSVEMAFRMFKKFHVRGILFASPTPGVGASVGYFF